MRETLLGVAWVRRKVLEKIIGFVRRSGLRTTVLERGHVKCVMPLKGNTNHVGTMYAGALATLAELPGGGLWLSSFDTQRFVPLLKELNIRFVKGARSDVSIEVRMDHAHLEELQASAERVGKVDFVLDAELKDTSGETVAVSHAVYQLRKR
jgi:acyl-coenzyme A thioesterase PaaI-like protein